MIPSHRIDRNTVNDVPVNVQNVPKSGFDLSYKSYNDYSLGKLHVSGHQFTMPNDYFSGSNQASLTFERMVVPNISDVIVSQHNFFVTLRSIDSTFENALCPSSLNNMSSSWHPATFNLRKLIKDILGTFCIDSTHFDSFLSDVASSTTLTASAISKLQTILSDMSQNIGTWETLSDKLYAKDISYEYYNRVNDYASNFIVGMPRQDVYVLIFDTFFTPFLGEGSLLDELGYNYVRYFDIYSVFHNTPSAPHPDSLVDYVDLFSDDNMNEYAIRAYYAVWYEYYRDPNLEPRSNNLPDWRNFGAASIVSNPLFLLRRIRSWQRDLYVSSMPDDISRHVFAPVYKQESTSSISVLDQSPNNSKDYLLSESVSERRNISTYQLSYLSPVDGQSHTLACPLPKQVNDCLVGVNSALSNNPYELDLFQLRNAQALERYLKRNFYFGDEYKDRMLAHYGSVVSDLRVNRPHLLSSSVSPINPSQVMSETSTSDSPQGTRNMTATASTSSDGFTFRSEEFGIVLNIISIMPTAQYSGCIGQHFLGNVTDFPLPEFAANNEEYGRTYEISAFGMSSPYFKQAFGHFPYAHIWRSRINEVHSSYCREKQDYTFRRFFGSDVNSTLPKLNYQFIHCRPNLDMFAPGFSKPYQKQVYGVVHHSFFVERPLPTPVETI